MSNPISKKMKTGTIGELLVQLRLLQFDVQANFPLKDTGNDLIAIKGEKFRTIQVKTSTVKAFPKQGLPAHYHLFALVHLEGENKDIFLDESNIYLIPKTIVENWNSDNELRDYLLSQGIVDKLFD